MADHGADEDLKSSSEERKKQMLKAKIVKSAKKKIEESEKVRAFATSCAASWTLGQQCTCSNGDANILQQPSAIVCGSWRTCKGVWGSPGHAQLLVFLR
jgi:hypothetical protein